MKINISEDRIITLFITISVLILLYTIYSQRRILFSKNSIDLLLKPTLLPLLIGSILVGIYLLLIAYSILGPFKNLLNTFLVSLFLIPIAIIGVYNILYFCNHRITLTTSRIEYINWKRQVEIIEWKEINSISRSIGFPRVTLFNINLITDKSNLKLDPLLIGFKSFELLIDKYNPDMGTLLKWILYHNPEGGNNYL